MFKMAASVQTGIKTTGTSHTGTADQIQQVKNEIREKAPAGSTVTFRVWKA